MVHVLYEDSSVISMIDCDCSTEIDCKICNNMRRLKVKSGTYYKVLGPFNKKMSEDKPD
jgi:hypothetical protein